VSSISFAVLDRHTTTAVSGMRPVSEVDRLGHECNHSDIQRVSAITTVFVPMLRTTGSKIGADEPPTRETL